MHTFSEDLKDAIHDPVPLLRVDLTGKVHRALHVREEYGHLLAFAFEGRLGLQDVVGEMFGSIRAGFEARGAKVSLALSFRLVTCCYRSVALATELLAGLVRRSALRAGRVSRAPQAAQNFRPSRFSCPHAAQVTVSTPGGTLLLLQDCCTRSCMPSQPLQVSEARKRLSALVERVARGGGAVTIGRYGRERAVLVGAEQYARLTRAAKRGSPRRQILEGTMELLCTPQELAAESRRLGELWLAALDGAPSRRPRRARRSRRPG